MRGDNLFVFATHPLDGERSMLNGEHPDTYDGSVESRCQDPHLSVATEQLYPSGRILQIDEHPKMYEVLYESLFISFV